MAEDGKSDTIKIIKLCPHFADTVPSSKVSTSHAPLATAQRQVWSHQRQVFPDRFVRRSNRKNVILDVYI
jgi:hypothetical protein